MAFARRRHPASLLAVLALFIQSAISEANCEASTFQGVNLLNGKILNIATQLHAGLSFEAPAEANHYSVNVTDLNACEVTITYTHPGYNDTINTSVWLPTPEKWTGRFLGAGGSGWSTGPDTNTTLPWAASEGYAVVATDGGHTGGDTEWSLVSPGNINWILLQDFSSITLNDAATLGKAVTEKYYGKAPSYSYWNGCSTGGRQGHMMAQRYPDQYDGILAAAPAIYWSQLMLQLFWPQVVMNENGMCFPTPCELEAINAAAIQSCDNLDGLEDGIISLPKECSFDPATVIGKEYICPSSNKSTIITETVATVARFIWQGATTSEGDFVWYPDNIGAPFSGLANTTCENGTCVGVPFFLPELWIRDFLTLDHEFDTTQINRTYFEELFHQSFNLYDSIIGTSDRNLDSFRKAGGKLINWQGLADQYVSPDTTTHYVKEVHERDSNASDYYRFFEAPGINHCGGGLGWYPGEGLKALIEWVENGVAPETLAAETSEGRKANLCLWPKHLVYVSGNPDEATSFECQ
ncbi:hypothetical protein COCSADRAFT_134024 [Bipolaris sorokiniana ND90Pr]|uniref:Carboxylic ester hydrolase n=1 Tax=Cochliobolus sativus (strain ND90Pr / ATCC 201652) TaxID=665912 RepID=M2RP06_COCSN|nr:uncharacterized protein COCSADRAFT_134024 [Bipolaris sorokiniana ND90Pr]EMD68364.1 hypothetical protein COCSADRAFT_134024 [Bipolaris sorokiniana ND90Pr]